MLSARGDRLIGIQGSRLPVLEEGDSTRSGILRQGEPVPICAVMQLGEVSSKTEV